MLFELVTKPKLSDTISILFVTMYTKYLNLL
jgi:hypothetical protein